MQLSREIDEIGRDDIELAIGEFGKRATSPEFERSLDEGGRAAESARGAQIVGMGRNHHHLFDRHVEQTSGAAIGFGIGLVVAEQFGRKDTVPRQPGILRL